MRCGHSGASPGVCMRLASRAWRKSCAVAHVWQELSALSLDLGDHPGGYQYLLFKLRMLMCGGLCGEAAETDAGSRSVASRDATRLHDAKKFGLRPGSVGVCTFCVESGCDCGHF